MTGAIQRLQEQAIKVVVAQKLEDSIGANRDLIERLMDDEGYVRPDQKPGEGIRLYDGLMMTFQLLQAYESARDFIKQSHTILRLQSVPLPVRADWARSLAWHHGYVVRERSIKFLRVFKEHASRGGEAGVAVALQLSDWERSFKRRTDPTFTQRGRHIHEHAVDDPITEQVSILTLLSQSPELKPFKELLKLRSVRLRAHMRQLIADHLGSILRDSEELIELSEPVWTAFLRYAAGASNVEIRREQ